MPVRLPVRLGKLINKTQKTRNSRNTVGAKRLSKKKKLLQLVDLELNPPNKHAGLVPVRLGKFNKTLTNR